MKLVPLSFCLSRMAKWCVTRCPALLCPASIQPLSTGSAAPSVSVSYDSEPRKSAEVTKFNRSYINSARLCVCEMKKTAGPSGPSGPSVRSPADVEGSRGADPATASCRHAPVRRCKPAAACRPSVNKRVRHHTARLMGYMSY